MGGRGHDGPAPLARSCSRRPGHLLGLSRTNGKERPGPTPGVADDGGVHEHGGGLRLEPALPERGELAWRPRTQVVAQASRATRSHGWRRRPRSRPVVSSPQGPPYQGRVPDGESSTSSDVPGSCGGQDATIVALAAMVPRALAAAERRRRRRRIDCTVIDLRSMSPSTPARSWSRCHRTDGVHGGGEPRCAAGARRSRRGRRGGFWDLTPRSCAPTPQHPDTLESAIEDLAIPSGTGVFENVRKNADDRRLIPTELLIGGRWSPAAAGGTFAVEDPRAAMRSGGGFAAGRRRRHRRRRRRGRPMRLGAARPQTAEVLRRAWRLVTEAPRPSRADRPRDGQACGRQGRDPLARSFSVVPKEALRNDGTVTRPAGDKEHTSG